MKYFTPEEADKMLPLVRKIAIDILDAGKHLAQIHEKLGDEASRDAAFVDFSERFDDLMDEMEELGCYYKDWGFDKGLVDFPSLMDGREVYLCWRTDEPHVQFYHDPESGYSGRKLIPNKEILQ
jgi:hypothetical protein